MSNKQTGIVIDGFTNLTTIVDLTSEELAERKESALAEQAKINAENAKQEARASALAKLAALGLTEEEIAAL